MEDDITEATDSSTVTSDNMLTNDPSKRPLAPNTKNSEDSKGDSNPQDVSVDDAVTKSSDHPEDKNDDSEPEVDTVVSTIGNGNTLNAKLSFSYKSLCDRLMDTGESDIQTYDNETGDETVAEVEYETEDDNEDDNEDESDIKLAFIATRSGLMRFKEEFDDDNDEQA